MNKDTSLADKARTIPMPNLLNALCNLTDRLEGMIDAVNEVRKQFEDSLPTIEEIVGIAKDNFDPEMRPLVDILNSLNDGNLIDVLSATFGDENTPAEIAFDVPHEDDLGDLRYDILATASRVKEARISISECYFLDDYRNLKSKWVLSITPNETEEVTQTKRQVIVHLTDAIEGYAGVMEEDSK